MNLLPATAVEVKANPLGKVLELMGSLTAQIAQEGEMEQKAYVEYVNWCDDAANTKKNEIKTGTAKKGDLEASIEKLTSNMAASDTEIGKLVESIAEQSKDLEDAT